MFKRILAFFIILMMNAAVAGAEEKTFLITDLASGQILAQSGLIDERQPPCSTFKVPLALMGFDQKILISAHDPVWPYKNEYNDSRPEVRQDIDPVSWLKVSAVWYSQVLTQKMGLETLNEYVKNFNYGNMDISGDPGLNNGLTKAWLSSSLKISTNEQVEFFKKMLLGKLPVSAQAVEAVKTTMPVFEAPGGWTVYGKTGSGPEVKADGSQNKNRPLGWFTGWAVKEGRTVVFAYLITGGGNGIKAREALLAEWPELMK